LDKVSTPPASLGVWRFSNLSLWLRFLYQPDPFCSIATSEVALTTPQLSAADAGATRRGDWAGEGRGEVVTLVFGRSRRLAWPRLNKRVVGKKTSFVGFCKGEL
jgi:hypothetical protein